MPTTEPEATESNRVNKAGYFVALLWVIFVFAGRLAHGGLIDAMAAALRLLIIVIVGGLVIHFVEMRLHGRARWWGRIAELGAASGALFLSIVWGLDRSAWLMAGIFWIGLCTLMITWMLVRVDVPD
jgi:hypothetical protein